MSFLTPLFLLGGLAIALPVIFHLIRRTTRERTQFSSLMFLLPTPPRLTRRSRLENLLLLLLRCLALALLAFGFSRPFLKGSTALDDPANESRRFVLLVDNSASMNRPGHWAAARAQADALLADTKPGDRVSVLAFNRQITTLVSFEEWNSTPVGDRAALARQRLAEAEPGWAATHLGNALTTAAEAVAEVDPDGPAGIRRVVLISDLQEGSRLEQLQAYDWPKGIELAVEPLKVRAASNAGLQLVGDGPDAASDTNQVVRVRVSNAADATKEQFQVGWAAADGSGFAATGEDVYVPPGQSRVIALNVPTNNAALGRILLRGDDVEFDNSVFVIPPQAAQLKVLYLGADDATDTRQPLFFLQRALPATKRQTVSVIARKAEETLPPDDVNEAGLIVVTDPLPEGRADALRERTLAGGTVLFAPRQPSAAPTLARLVGASSLAMSEAVVSDYAMLGEIDFRHPLLAPFADPRFSDFTKIHFWKHRRLDATALPGAHVIARFDSGDPALLEVPVGRGRVIVLASGWHPADSQLALSTKFVPLLFSLLELGGAVAAAPQQHFVGDTAAIPADLTTSATQLRLPDGTTIALAAGATNFPAPRLPGIYALESAARPFRFAVNVDPAESRTAPLPLDELERFGAPLATDEPLPETVKAEQASQLLGAEAESRQKLWRWFIVATLAILLIESVLAARTLRQATAEAPATP